MRTRFPVRRAVVLAAVFPISMLGLAGESAGAQSCVSGTANDFDGDGVTDVAIADSDATVGGVKRAGRVHIVYGGGGSQTISQADGYVSGNPEPGDRFGFALATVDWNGDGCTDLVAGTPFEAIGSEAEAGWADVLYGSPSGFGPNGGQRFSQDTAGMPGGAEPGDRFAYDIAAGVTTGGEPFLAFGVPGEDLNSLGGVSQVDAGAVSYVRGSTMAMIDQNKPGVVGFVEAGDQYGYAVAATPRRLAIGGPGEALGEDNYSGTIGVFTHDVEAGTIDVWSQDQPGNSGGSEPSDWCGRSLAMTDYIPPGSSQVRTLLVIGCPGEAVGTTDSSGRMITADVTGSLSELESIEQAKPDVAGAIGVNDYLGWSVQAVNRSPGSAVAWQDLLVVAGVPGEDTTGPTDGGGVQVFSAIGQPGDHDTWAQEHGMAGAGWQPAEATRLGQHLGGSATHLYVADPYGVTPAVYAIPWANIVGGASDEVRVYQPGEDGLPTTGVGSFGGAIV